MKNAKKLTVALFMALLFVVLSVSMPFAANAEIAYSKLDPELLSEFETRGNNSKISTLLWLEDNTTDDYQAEVSKIAPPEAGDFGVVEQSPEQLSRSTPDNLNIEFTTEKQAYMEAMQNHIMQKRQIAQAMYYEDNSAVASKLASKLSGGEIVYISRYSPLIVCKLSRTEAVKMAMNSNVLSISYGEYQEEPQMDVSLNAVKATALHTNYNILGQGIKIGMLENAVPDISNANFDGIRNKITIMPYDFPLKVNYIPHATKVASIMVGNDIGVARGFEHLYCAPLNGGSTRFEHTEWLLNQGVNVINNSWRPVYNSSPQQRYDTYSLWMDHIAYNHSVHMVMAAANSGADTVSSIAMAYNVISVGATDDKGTPDCTNDTIWEYSSYNNSFDNLAYKPDLCAPGTNLSIPEFDGPQHGTSLSAPHVTGIVAMLCSYAPTLLTKQALLKSILMSGVSTKKCFDTSELIETYRQYGAGIVNAYNAKRIIDTNGYVNSSVTASQDGKIYSIGSVQEGQTVSVTLCFLKRVRFTSSDHTQGDPSVNSEIANLDLDVKGASESAHQTPLAYSITTNNNVEKIIFEAPKTDEYNIIISKVESNQDPYEILFAVSWLKHTADLP